MSDFLTTMPPQVLENSRFDPVTPARIFSDGDARAPDLGGYGHFNPAPKLTPQVATKVTPVFLGEFRESNSQSSRVSVKKSGGQSNSLAPLASLSFLSRARVAAYVRSVLGGGIAMMEWWPLPSRMMYSP